MKPALTLALTIGLIVGFALGANWQSGSRHDRADPAPSEAKLTALSESTQPTNTPAAALLPPAVTELAGKPVASLLDRAIDVRGRYELFAYIDSLDSHALALLAARVIAEANPNHSGVYPTLKAIYTCWVEIEPEAAFQHALKIDHKGKRSIALRIVFGQLATDDFVAARQRLESLTEPNLRSIALDEICVSGAKTAPEKVFALIGSHNDSTDNQRRYERLMEAWAYQDSAAAKAHAEMLAPGRARDGALSGIVHTLAQYQPHQATSFIDALENGDDRKRLASTMAAWMAATTPEITAEWILDQTDPQLRSNVLGNLLTNWVRHDVDASIAFVETLEGEERKPALRRVLSGVAREQPARAAALLGTDLEPGDRDFVYEISRHWASDDATAAAEWISSLPAGAPRQEGQKTLIREWVVRDPAATSAWVADLPRDDPGRETAVSTLAYGLMRSDPEAALHWSTEIEHPAQGPSFIIKAATNWVAQDRADAETALAEGSLPDAARDALREQLAKKTEE